MKKDYFITVYKKGENKIIDNTNIVSKVSLYSFTKEQYDKVMITIHEIFPDCETAHDEFDSE